MAEARTAYQDFLRCGKTRTRIFRSSSRRRQSAPSCNELLRSDPRFADHSESSEHLHRQRHRRTGQPVFHLYGVSGWQVTAAVKEKVVDALGGAATKLRAELGESLATVQKFDVPLVQATTSSLEALKAYSLGGKASREKGANADLPYTSRAIELDPNFAAAYEAVGGDYFSLAKDEEGRKYITKAFQLRGHASDCPRAFPVRD